MLELCTRSPKTDKNNIFFLFSRFGRKKTFLSGIRVVTTPQPGADGVRILSKRLPSNTAAVRTQGSMPNLSYLLRKDIWVRFSTSWEWNCSTRNLLAYAAFFKVLGIKSANENKSGKRMKRKFAFHVFEFWEFLLQWLVASHLFWNSHILAVKEQG